MRQISCVSSRVKAAGTTGHFLQRHTAGGDATCLKLRGSLCSCWTLPVSSSVCKLTHLWLLKQPYDQVWLFIKNKGIFFVIRLKVKDSHSAAPFLTVVKLFKQIHSNDLNYTSYKYTWEGLRFKETGRKMEKKEKQQSPTLCVLIFPSKAVFLAQCLECNHSTDMLQRHWMWLTTLQWYCGKELNKPLYRVWFISCHI